MNKKAFYNNIERYLIIALFIVMIIITALNVVTRFFFNFTLSWGEQLARLLLVWISFAGVSWAGLINVHMRVTAISLLFKKHPKVFDIILLVADIITVIFSFYISYRIAVFTIMIASQGQVLSAMPFTPKWVMYLAGVLGMAGLGVRIIQKNVITFIEKKKEVKA